MTGLLLATLLNLSPGIQLADNVESRHVVLSEARFRPQFVADYAEDGPRPNLDAMTRDQLDSELRRLDESKPNIVGPIVLLSVGGGLAIPGTYFLYLAISAATNATGSFASLSIVVAYFAGIVGGLFLTAAVVMIVIGAITLPMKLSAKKAHDADTSAIRRRLDSMAPGAPPEAPPPPPPPGPDSVPPPPPPPPQANLVVPGAMQTLMTF